MCVCIGNLLLQPAFSFVSRWHHPKRKLFSAWLNEPVVCCRRWIAMCECVRDLCLRKKVCICVHSDDLCCYVRRGEIWSSVNTVHSTESSINIPERLVLQNCFFFSFSCWLVDTQDVIFMNRIIKRNETASC